MAEAPSTNWKTDINGLAQQVVAWREHQGFHCPASLETEAERDAMLGKLMLLTTEVAEAAEAVRHCDPENFREELADVMIRLLDIAGTTGTDLEAEVHEKMNKNAARPHRHGKHCSL